MAEAGGSLRAKLQGIRTHANMMPSQMKTRGRVPSVPHDQEWGQSLAQEKAADAETHYHDSRGQPLAVRKPLCHGSNRSNVPQSDSRAAYHAVTQIKQRDDIQVQGQSGNQITAREQYASGQREKPRASRGSMFPAQAADTPKEKIAILNAQAV